MFQRNDEERLFPVRVFNKKGKLKRVIQVSKLKKRHWEIFEEGVQRRVTGRSFVMFDHPENPLAGTQTPSGSLENLDGLFQ